ncbi:MAG: SRPBCC family protein [Saprospiraceae bacterium]|nr:SRPBCC family protein [Saprospiraceae bacterium]
MIKVETIIRKDIATVWQCWTSPEHVVNWNFASDDWHCPTAENDLQVGGKFTYTMASKDGQMSFDFWGIYDEIFPHQKIEITLGDGRKMIVRFVPSDNVTTIIESFEPEKINSEELQRNGWQAILDNFKKYTESI